MRNKIDLAQRQALPLEAKVTMSLNRIREWYQYYGGDVFVSFSGGKDSTVLAHLVHSIYPDVPLVFSNTGLEFLEIQSFALSKGAVDIRPKMMFSEVISKYGYPIISKENADVIYGARKIFNGSKRPRAGYGESKTNEEGIWLNWRRKALHGIAPFDHGMFEKKKWLPMARDTLFPISHYCCNVMKKDPLSKYEKQSGRRSFIGVLAVESASRERTWIKYGCNAFDNKHPTSQPLAFWTEQDIIDYIMLNKLDICSVYGEVSKEGFSGYNRTGCIFCCFGCHLEKGETRFQRLAKTHPRQYEYCLGGGQWVDNPNYDEFAPEYDDFWKNWNPRKIWVPSKEGLGMRFVFDCCNEIYGKEFIRYE